MKRILVCLLTLSLLLSLASVGTSAADYETDSAAWSEMQLHALFIQQGDFTFSDLAEQYEGLWWDGEIPEMDNMYVSGADINMRGFSMSHDAKYAYMGTLNNTTADRARGVVVLDTSTGAITDLYYHYDSAPPEGNTPFSYAKGIAADSRGYVYVGFAHASNINTVYLGIAEQKDDGTLEEAACIPACELGEAGANGGTKVGVNGVAISERDDRTLCYVMLNYDYDALCCFDVTDPKNPVLYKDFGDDGVIDFSKGDVVGDGFTLKEGQYLDIDEEDGAVYLCVNANEGKDGIMVIEPDGSECREVIEVPGIYCLELVGEFMLCGLKDGTSVNVLDRESREKVATIPLTAPYGDRVVRMQVIKDVLFVADAGNDNSTSNAIHVGALSDKGLDFIHEMMAGMNLGVTEEESDSETTTESTTESVSVTETDSAAVTETAQTAEKATNGVKEPATAEGCASVLVPAGMLVLLSAAVVLRKKH